MSQNFEDVVDGGSGSPHTEVKKILKTSGEVRIGVGMGITMRAGLSDAYIKPTFYLESGVPEDYDPEEYIEVLKMFVEEKLLEMILNLHDVVGAKVKK